MLVVPSYYLCHYQEWYKHVINQLDTSGNSFRKHAINQLGTSGISFRDVGWCRQLVLMAAARSLLLLRALHQSPLLRDGYQVVVAGGGIMGCSSAYFLAKRMPPEQILVVEKDPTVYNSHCAGILTSLSLSSVI